MKQIIKRGIVFLLAVVMMTCQSSILSLAEEERETTENTDNEEKEQKETEDTKEMECSFNGSIDWESFV